MREVKRWEVGYFKLRTEEIGLPTHLLLFYRNFNPSFLIKKESGDMRSPCCLCAYEFLQTIPTRSITKHVNVQSAVLSRFSNGIRARFSSPQRAHRLSGPPSLLSIGYRGDISLGIKRLGISADHSPPSSANFKNRGVIPPLQTPSCGGT